VRPGRDADPSPPSSAEVKNRAISLLSLRAFVAYERAKPTYKTLIVLQDVRLFLFLEIFHIPSNCKYFRKMKSFSHICSREKHVYFINFVSK